MLKRFYVVTVVVVAFYVEPAFAQVAPAQTSGGGFIDIGQAFGPTIGPYVNTFVGGLVLIGTTWILNILRNKLNINIEAQYRDALIAFLQRQAASLVQLGAVKLNGVKIEIDNPLLYQAAETALQAIPGVMTFFGLTPGKVAEMIADFVSKHPAVAQATAIALDVKNPETPSTAPATAPAVKA